MLCNPPPLHFPGHYMTSGLTVSKLEKALDILHASFLEHDHTETHFPECQLQGKSMSDGVPSIGQAHLQAS